MCYKLDVERPSSYLLISSLADHRSHSHVAWSPYPFPPQCQRSLCWMISINSDRCIRISPLAFKRTAKIVSRLISPRKLVETYARFTCLPALLSKRLQTYIAELSHATLISKKISLFFGHSLALIPHPYLRVLPKGWHTEYTSHSANNCAFRVR